MQRTTLIRLAMLSTLASIVLALSLTATAQSSAPASAGTFPTTRVATDCDSVANCRTIIDQLNQRLDKVLDAFEAQGRKITADADEKAALRSLDALKDELLAAKDQMIKDVMADNDFLRKQVHPSKSKLQAFFERVEKILILAAGVYIGKGL